VLALRLLTLSWAGRGDRHEDLHLARLELGTKGGELVVLELVFERERLEGGLLDLAVLLGLFESGLDRCFEFDRAQFSSLPSWCRYVTGTRIHAVPRTSSKRGTGPAYSSSSAFRRSKSRLSS
jgi:hypothetical protein